MSYVLQIEIKIDVRSMMMRTEQVEIEIAD